MREVISAILRAMNDAASFANLPPGTTVTVRALKYDGVEYRRWSCQFSGLVAGGVVLEAVFTPVVEGRTPFFGGDRAVEYFYTDRSYNVIAGYAPDGTLRACYCNICTPAELALVPRGKTTAEPGAELRFVDLDIDVLVAANGSCIVTDEDEFEENARRYGYAPTVRRSAREAVAALLAAVRERQAPFDAIGLAPA